MSRTHKVKSLFQRLNLRADLNKGTRKAGQSYSNALHLRRAVGLLLIICIFAASTPATTLSLAGAFSEWQNGVTFWLASSGWSGFFHHGISRNAGLTSSAARPS